MNYPGTDLKFKVNAQLSGMTVTITNRHGQASSVNIGFEIYQTYASVAAMNADGTAGYPGEAGYFYSWDYPRQQYVHGPKLSLDWASMTQAERDQLAQDILAAISFDNAPTENSDNAVKSGGIYTALARKQDKLTFASAATCESIIDEIVHVTAGE